MADTIKLSGLNVPILVQAYPDDLGQLIVERRRDAFCGKISVCNDLRQYGYAYTLTNLHTVHPLQRQLPRPTWTKFVGVCRVVKGLRNARLGAVGARPGNFNTVRFSEKTAPGLRDQRRHGGSVGDLWRCAQAGSKTMTPGSKPNWRRSRATAKSEACRPASLVRMAKLGIVLDDWMAGK